MTDRESLARRGVIVVTAAAVVRVLLVMTGNDAPGPVVYAFTAVWLSVVGLVVWRGAEAVRSGRGSIADAVWRSVAVIACGVPIVDARSSSAANDVLWIAMALLAAAAYLSVPARSRDGDPDAG